MGTISFSSDPPYAQIYIDGELVGTTSSQMKVSIKGVSCGDHTVELTMDGYETYTKEVTVEGGTGYGVSAVMVPLAEETATAVAEEATTVATSTPTPQEPDTQATPGILAITVIAGIIVCMAVFRSGR